ncbi:hypothetical protein GOBAR_DD12423 [Gossypium barbadense]|nr:hypothetical protein GOBAR_DD12423 [Gossypium barbadense]
MNARWRVKIYTPIQLEYFLGTVIDLQTLLHRGPDDEIESRKRVFQRLFWTFESCIKAFLHCKLLVHVDKTWLYNKYTQILLIVVAEDGNRNARQHLPHLRQIEGTTCCGKTFGGSIEARHVDAKDGAETCKVDRDWARGYECRSFQTLRYPCAHVHAAYAHANLDVKKFTDEVYTVQRTFRIWGKEFLVMSDVSN